MRRALSILCIASLCAVAAGASVAGAQASSTTIASGVTIGSVDVGGLSGWDATVAVKTAYYAPIVVSAAHKHFTVKTMHFHTSVPVKGAVQTALAAPADTAIPLTTVFDKKLVHKWIARLAPQVYRAAKPGAIVLHHGHPVLFHQHPGHELMKFPTWIFVRNALNTGTRPAIVAPLRVLNAPDVKVGPIIVIHRAANRLVLFRGERYVRSFPVATGQPIYPTPLGHFEIVVKEKNPWWYPPTQDAWARGLKPVPPGPGNPLGTRWMGLSAPGVGIHGTSEPWSIGHSESHGCIRMQIPDAEWLYKRVRVGTPVFIIPR
jgi:lipoprotein-anchoring transpeptidase ErfK/SrfK